MFTIGVCGGSGSGKTLFCEKLREFFKDESVCIINCDNYYDNSRPYCIKHNYDHPSAIDFSLLIKNLSDLNSGKEVFYPAYNFITHSRLKKYNRDIPADICIVEGVLIFACKRLLNKFDLKIFIDTSVDIRFIRRLRRDIKERGRNVEQVINQYLKTVKPMHDKFVESKKNFAEIVVDGNRKFDLKTFLKVKQFYSAFMRK